MINDSSLSSYIKSWKTSSQNKLDQHQKDMKSKIFTQFNKISKENLLNEAIIEVYNVILFDKESAPFSSILSSPDFDPGLIKYLSLQMSQFYSEASIISEDGFNLMTYFEFILNKFDDRYIYWCSYPQISYDIIEEANTYYFTLIKFNANIYIKNLYFNNEVHPFIKKLNYTWISQFKEPSYDNTFRKAAASMNELLGGIWDHINILSTLKYEGSQNIGSIMFTGEFKPTLLLSLETPVSLSHYRQIRKLLQMSHSQYNLIIDSNYMAIGFGFISSSEPIYRIDFLDHLSWKLYYGEAEFLSCYNLLPLLPNTGRDMLKLQEQLQLTFKHLLYNEKQIIQIINEAKTQRKGTMIVVTKKAKEEAERLKTSSIKIRPIQLTKKQIKMVTGIDGAVIIDINGYCHVIGSILDGFANDNGDSSRGARYNSALRYLNTQKNANEPCLIAVISEDGYIDILSTQSL